MLFPEGTFTVVQQSCCQPFVALAVAFPSVSARCAGCSDSKKSASVFTSSPPLIVAVPRTHARSRANLVSTPAPHTCCWLHSCFRLGSLRLTFLTKGARHSDTTLCFGQIILLDLVHDDRVSVCSNKIRHSHKHVEGKHKEVNGRSERHTPIEMYCQPSTGDRTGQAHEQVERSRGTLKGQSSTNVCTHAHTQTAWKILLARNASHEIRHTHEQVVNGHVVPND